VGIVVKQKQFDAVIRARVTKLQKVNIAKVAASRQLDPSDIIREAINRYLASKKGAVA
jgi:DNA-directed RNA polymerase specialized sigma54-like protein